MDEKYATISSGGMLTMAQEDADRVFMARRILSEKKRSKAIEALEDDIDSKVDIGGYPEAFTDAYERLQRAYMVGKAQGQAEYIVFGIGFVLGVAAFGTVFLKRKKILAKAKEIKARVTHKES